MLKIASAEKTYHRNIKFYFFSLIIFSNFYLSFPKWEGCFCYEISVIRFIYCPQKLVSFHVLLITRGGIGLGV